MPDALERERLPMQAKPIGVMDIERLKQRMSQSARARFEEVWRMTFYGATGAAYVPRGGKSDLLDRHGDQLVEAGLAVRVPREAVGGSMENVPFTVVEEKPAGLRQRFILWTRQLNCDLAAEGYVAKVPLYHVSKYLTDVNLDFAATRDLRQGFYAIEIPEEARIKFEFLTATGERLRMCRLPMGLATAPELMQMLTSCIAGDPAVVQPAHAAKSRVRVWIDNIKLSGCEGVVTADAARMDAVAEACGATWSPEDTRAGRRVEFIGVTWDHASHQVSLSERLRARVMAPIPVDVDPPKVEEIVGRLLFASAVSGVVLAPYYFCLKWARRAMRRPNSDIPEGVTRALRRWSAAVLVPREIPARPAPFVTLFVDASLKGWGAVRVDEVNRIDVLGEAWNTEEASRHINVLEATALRKALQRTGPVPRGAGLRVLVDNTTVLGSVRRGASRNDFLNEEVECIRTLIGGSYVTLEYVRSGSNPADAPSREPLDAAAPAAIQAVRRFFGAEDMDSRCGGGDPADGSQVKDHLASVNPLRKEIV